MLEDDDVIRKAYEERGRDGNGLDVDFGAYRLYAIVSLFVPVSSGQVPCGSRSTAVFGFFDGLER